jgi:hypothetical protein
MKGVSSEVIVFLVVAIIIGVVVILFFTGKFSPGQKIISESDCRSNYETVCGTYKSTGDMWSLTKFPSSCVKLLGLEEGAFKACTDITKKDEERRPDCDFFCRT